jgi:hypothetical protein
MLFNFAEAIARMGRDAAVRIANGARPPANYLFNTFLPERNMLDYNVEASNMIVRTTMAGLVGMDSPYPPGGTVEVSSFLEKSAKIAISNTLTEGALRQLQAIMRQMQIDGGLSNDFLQREALNFLQKVIVQALLDTDEWLRGQALVYGLINWTFNQKQLYVNYGVPAANFLTERTNSNNDSYSDSSSAFWTDLLEARRLLRYNVRAAIMNSTTMDKIVGNTANNLEILSQDNSMFTVRKYRTVGGNTVPESDNRYQMQFTVYDEEAEVLDTTAGSLGRTQTVKFMPDGKILFIGQNTNSGYRVGQGSTDNPRNDMELGYHHIAPTVEGNGASGRWSRLYTPEGYPMQLRGEAVENSLPVILNPDKIVVATTEMAP